MQDYYAAPVNLGLLVKKKRLKRLSLRESVEQHLYLIIISRFGEFRYDYHYGCGLWDYDFEVLPRGTSWKGQLEKSMAEVMDKLEPRLSQVSVKVEITQEHIRSLSFVRAGRLKKCIRISVKGLLVPTNEPFAKDDYQVYFSPISLD